MTGVILDFMMGKLVLAVGVLALLGCAFSLAETSERFQENQRLEVFLSQISEALEAAGTLPGDVEIERRLPDLPGVEVEITGEFSGGVERIRVVIAGDGRLVREIRIPAVVNDGDFRITAENPASVRVSKRVEELRDPFWSMLFRIFGWNRTATRITLEVR